MNNMFVVIWVGVKPIPRLSLHSARTLYLVTNADWNYSEEGGSMSGDQREPDFLRIIPANQ